ncbi:MAG: phosphatase PAP2 family protein [Ruminococcaceae bacterium]|nr:phosphatase PAP2 family protein [Oscillospiraceae bacterium]
MFEALNQFEAGILEGIHNIFGCGFLDRTLSFITKFADHGIGWIIVALVLLCFKKTRKTGLMVGLALIFGLIVGNMTLKPLVARIRPYDLAGMEAIREALLVPPLSDFSFPSGHTLASFEAASVLMIRNKKLGIPALVLAIIIAFSRLYLFVHYPSDVLTGLILGTLFGVIAVLIVNKLWALTEAKIKERKAE